MRRAAALLGRALLSTSSGATSSAAVAVASQPLAAVLASACIVPWNAQLRAAALTNPSYSTNSHDLFNTHRDTPDNNQTTTFEWTEANLKICKEIIEHYPPNYKASAVIPVLDIAQQQNAGYLSLAAMNSVAKLLEMPEIRVYEVATFYSMFNRTKMGKYHVMVCGTTPCRLQGSEKIQAAIEKHLGVHIGETTKDGMFTFSEMECMGACVNAPMIAIADYSHGVDKFTYLYYEDLTPETTVSILEALKKGEKPRVGSQFRSKAEPAGCIAGGSKWVPSEGQQTLTGAIRGPYAPFLESLSK